MYRWGGGNYLIILRCWPVLKGTRPKGTWKHSVHKGWEDRGLIVSFSSHCQSTEGVHCTLYTKQLGWPQYDKMAWVPKEERTLPALVAGFQIQSYICQLGYSTRLHFRGSCSSNWLKVQIPFVCEVTFLPHCTFLSFSNSNICVSASLSDSL